MAAVDYFLKITGIPGESMDKAHPNEIDVLSWSWSQSNSGSFTAGGAGKGGGAGKVIMQDFTFQMMVNASSPALFLACAVGQHITEVVLTCRKAGKTQQEYLKLTFSNVLVSSYSTGGSAGDTIPIESVTLNFSKIQHSYASQKPDGTLNSPVMHQYDAAVQVGS